MNKPCVVLLSGGLDSTTTLYIARAEGYVVHALSFEYGQRHIAELDAARRVATVAGVAEHHVVRVDLGALGGSALTDPKIDVPLDRTDEQIAEGVPSTYVPARNTIFLAYALAVAEVRSINDVFLGVNHIDSSGYPDCRPEFLRAFEAVANIGTRAGSEGAGFHIHAPLVTMTKAEIIRRGLELGVDYAVTRSCYAPIGDAHGCGRCDACRLRLTGFAGAGEIDPAPYASDAPRPDLWLRNARA